MNIFLCYKNRIKATREDNERRTAPFFFHKKQYSSLRILETYTRKVHVFQNIVNHLGRKKTITAYVLKTA